MDMTFSEEDLEFQQEVRAFLSEHLSEDLASATRYNPAVFSDRVDQFEWQKILHQKSWVGHRWPAEYGGTGWSATQRYIFDDECRRAGAPIISPMSMDLVGPVIYTYGTDAQKEKFLPNILSGEDFWCQGFSEPEAGSDLASLKTSAVRDGDDYVVNGTKIWTSLAHNANWIFCLVRTCKEVKPQAGISFLLIDMSAPGLEVEPIITLAGDHDINQVFFEDVRVPAENLVGSEGQGWEIAKFLLEKERGGAPMAPGLRAHFNHIQTYLQDLEDGHCGRLLNDPSVKTKLSEIDVELRALEVMELRLLDQISRGEPLGPQSSISKIVGANLRQKIDQIAIDLFGQDALQLAPERPLHGSQGPEFEGSLGALIAMPTYLNSRAWTIFGGSNEIQRTILAKTVLGL